VIPSVPIASGTEGVEGVQRGDIEVSGLDHGGPSYEVRIFLDNPHADAETELTPDNGYAASIYVYGYGDPPAGEAAGRAGRASNPITRSVIATEAVRSAAQRGRQATVTLVAVGNEGDDIDIDLDAAAVSVLVDGQAADPPGR
jgi:hypothetical protein